MLLYLKMRIEENPIFFLNFFLSRSNVPHGEEVRGEAEFEVAEYVLPKVAISCKGHY